jgi:hypothetical protein
VTAGAFLFKQWWLLKRVRDLVPMLRKPRRAPGQSPTANPSLRGARETRTAGSPSSDGASHEQNE